MPDALAKGTAAAVAALLVAVIGILVVTSSPPTGARQVTAEFDDAFPLIEGMHVRVDGAIAGEVGSIEVNDRGNAEVDLVLHDSVPPPKADAVAAIRQQDTTGDSYVDFDPGTSEESLGEDGIVCELGPGGEETCPSTLVAPRLDDLLNAFGPAERSGVQLILVELSKALDRRGRDLNRAALTLLPAIESANQALGEVREQNAALRRLVSSAESVTGQAARRNRELGRLVEGLAVTTDVTATNAAALDAGLERLPETAARARTTLQALGRAAVAGRPLAEELAAGAPELGTALGRLPGFLDHAQGFLIDNRSVLKLTRKLLHDAEPTLKIGKKRIVTGAFDLTGATADLLNSVLGGEDAFPALFDDDSYGEPGGTLGRRGFGAVAVEPGDLSGYPASHADRNWLRVSAVINCEVFGEPVRPGCLFDALSGSSAAAIGHGRRTPSKGAAGRGRPQSIRPSRSGADSGGGEARPGAGGRALDGILDARPPRLGGGGGERKRGHSGPGGEALDRGIDNLLDYLIGNG